MTVKTLRTNSASRKRKARSLTKFSRQLLNEWNRLQLGSDNATVIVAVSGGADSAALLLGLDELIQKGRLKVRLLVAHLDHVLRGRSSREDALWVRKLAKGLGYRATVGKIEVRKQATKSRDNLEQAARRARYDFFARLAKKSGASLVVTGHTMDDQAETVLLNLARGSGGDGLAGMEPLRRLNATGSTRVARPLMFWARRSATEDYCRVRAVEFRTDAMNLDEQFARVRVRQKLLPLMQTLNPKIVEALSRTADLLREDKIALNSAAERLLELASENSTGKKTARLRLDLLTLAPVAVRRRALRQWIAQFRGDLRRIEMVHVAAVESLLSGDRGGRTIELPGGARVTRRQGWLLFRD